MLLDKVRTAQNIERLAKRAKRLGVSLRPHLKTAKSTGIALRLTEGTRGPITVSTLAEAEAFHEAGFADILYAVGIAPQKLTRVQALRGRGCDLVVILDSAAQAQAALEARVRALKEMDSDGHRGGLRPDDPALVEVGRILDAGGQRRGVTTHAGESYTMRGEAAHADFAERERERSAAEALRAEGLPCQVVSAGSTPTAHAARDLAGRHRVVRRGLHVLRPRHGGDRRDKGATSTRPAASRLCVRTAMLFMILIGTSVVQFFDTTRQQSVFGRA